MKVDLTEDELKHIFYMSKEDIEDGKKAIEDCPKAILLHQEWMKCFELDRDIMEKCKNCLRKLKPKKIRRKNQNEHS